MKHSVRIQETDRTVEIKDGEDNLKYLATLEKGVDEELQTVFIVKIIKYKGLDEEPETMFDESYYTLDEANRNFDIMVRNYVFLVKAETKPVDDIKLYSERIQYHHIDTDCCLNCEFSTNKPEKLRPHRPHECKPIELRCMNPDNFIIFENIVKMGHGCDCHDYDNCPFDFKEDGGWIIPRPQPGVPHDRCHCMTDFDNCQYEVCPKRKMIPRPKPPEPRNMLLVHPRVDFNGICKNYKRRIKPRPEPRPRPVV